MIPADDLNRIKMNEKLIKYSICICNYNMADTIERALISVLDQVDKRFEVLVIDDGSSDNSIEIMKSLQKKYDNLRVIALKRDKKRELGETRNISIREAKGEYVLLHIDADDVWEPFLISFINLFHRLEGLIKKDVLVSGQQVNIARREFLLSHGPYRNTHRAQDRDLWHRMASIDAYIPVDHIIFRKRLSRPFSIRLKRLFRNTWFQLLYDLRQGTRTGEYVIACYTSFFRHNKNISFLLKILRAILIIPAFIKNIFSEPLPMPKSMRGHNEFVKYREKMRGTFPELFQRYGGSPDISNMRVKEQFIFNNSNK